MSAQGMSGLREAVEALADEIADHNTDTHRGIAARLRAVLAAHPADPAPDLAAAGDLDAAIERIEKSRQTHVEWRDYWREYESHTCSADPCPWEAVREEQEAIAGDVAHQEEAISGYDNVLTILRSLAAARAAVSEAGGGEQ